MEQQEQKLLILIFYQNRDLLEGVADAVAAIRAYLAARKGEVNAD